MHMIAIIIYTITSRAIYLKQMKGMALLIQEILDCPACIIIIVMLTIIAKLAIASYLYILLFTE